MLRRLHKGAEAVAATLLAAMFLSFVVQVFFRYAINDPLGWTLEACLTLWLWSVFWGAAFLLQPQEQVTFDMLYQAVGPRTRWLFALISSLAITVAFAVSLPATISFITFYSIKDSATLGIRMDYVFSIYGVFAVAVIVRYGWRSVRLLRGQMPDEMGGGL
jgi:C4-dicarboxylate transporter DctQ subunit